MATWRRWPPRRPAPSPDPPPAPSRRPAFSDAVECPRESQTRLRGGVPRRARRGPRVRPGGLHRAMGAALPGRHDRAGARPRARRLHRAAAQRRGAAARRQLGRRSHFGGRGIPVPAALGRLLAARARTPSGLGRLRCANTAHRGVPHLHRRLREPAHDLSRRPSPSAGLRRPHLPGLLDRRVDRQHAHDHDHAPQAGLPAAQRRPAQREGAAHRALDRARLVSHHRERARGSGHPHRAAGAQPVVVPRPGPAGRPLSLRVRAGSAGRAGHCAPPPARDQSQPAGVLELVRGAGRRGPRRARRRSTRSSSPSCGRTSRKIGASASATASDSPAASPSPVP
jgi:hypothetical protein